MKFLASLILSMAVAIGAAAQSTPASVKVATTTANPQPNLSAKDQARQKFVMDVVQSAVSLQESDPQDRLRVLTTAANVLGPINAKLTQQFATEGTAIESKLVAEGQRPAVSMLSGGHVDCGSAMTFVQMLPPTAVLDAEQSLLGAITNCPKQVNEAAKRKLEAGLEQGVVAGRPILALMDAEGMSTPWSQAIFVKMFSSLPADAAPLAQEAANYAATFDRSAKEMDKDSVKAAGGKFLSWLAKLPDSPQRGMAVNLATGALSDALGAAAYQELLRSDPQVQQIATSAGQNATLPSPDDQSVSVLRAIGNNGDRTSELQAMAASQRAREAAASGFASGTSGDRKTADRYFDIAFASVDEVWSDRTNPKVDAPEVVQEVSEAAAQVDALAALQRSQQLQDPSASAISMLAVAKVVAGSE